MRQTFKTDDRRPTARRSGGVRSEQRPFSAAKLNVLRRDERVWATEGQFQIVREPFERT
jgi:hypothetical protein